MTTYSSQQLYEGVALPPNLQIMNLNLRDLHDHTVRAMAECGTETPVCSRLHVLSPRQSLLPDAPCIYRSSSLCSGTVSSTGGTRSCQVSVGLGPSSGQSSPSVSGSLEQGRGGPAKCTVTAMTRQAVEAREMGMKTAQTTYVNRAGRQGDGALGLAEPCHVGLPTEPPRLDSRCALTVTRPSRIQRVKTPAR